MWQAAVEARKQEEADRKRRKAEKEAERKRLEAEEEERRRREEEAARVQDFKNNQEAIRIFFGGLLYFGLIILPAIAIFLTCLSIVVYPERRNTVTTTKRFTHKIGRQATACYGGIRDANTWDWPGYHTYYCEVQKSTRIYSEPIIMVLKWIALFWTITIVGLIILAIQFEAEDDSFSKDDYYSLALEGLYMIFCYKYGAVTMLFVALAVAGIWLGNEFY